MNQNYKRLFNNLHKIEPPESLYKTIISRIQFEKIRRAKIRLVFFGITALASITASVPALSVVHRELTSSGFYQYIPLIYSDSGLVLFQWKEFSLLLIESLPTVSIIIFMTVIFTFIVSFKSIMKNVIIFSYKLN